LVGAFVDESIVGFDEAIGQAAAELRHELCDFIGRLNEFDADRHVFVVRPARLRFVDPVVKAKARGGANEAGTGYAV